MHCISSCRDQKAGRRRPHYMANRSHTKQSNKKSNQLRIIGGNLRSRVIRFPDVDGLRPTSDRIRETVFNWLQDRLLGSRCLDLFAGSGALGIEALSRGAAAVQFVENNHQAAAALKHNLTELELSAGGIAVSSAQQWIESEQSKAPFNIVFLDPPFGQSLGEVMCKALANANLIAENGLIYLEQSSSEEKKELPKEFVVLKSKQAGHVSYSLYQYNQSAADT